MRVITISTVLGLMGVVDTLITFCIVSIAPAVLGFIMGYYVGCSQSPAVGAYLTGILGLIGLIGGVFIKTITSEGRDSTNHFPSLLNSLGFAVIIFSLASWAGTNRGIEFRRSDWLSLTSVSSCSNKLDPVEMGKLVFLQRRMFATGIRTDDNNKIIKSLIDSNEQKKVDSLLAAFADMPNGPCTWAFPSSVTVGEDDEIKKLLPAPTSTPRKP